MWVEQALEDSTIVRRFRELPTRQRQASMAAGILVAIVVVYIGIWEPVFDYRENAIDRMTTARQNLEWMQQNETAARGRLNSCADKVVVSRACVL